MAKSSRQKKQARQKAQAKRAEQVRIRTRAEYERKLDAAYRELSDPRTPPARVAALVAEYEADSPFAGGTARLRLHSGSSLPDLAETARLLLETTAEPRGIGVLAFLTSAAHESGDTEAERRHIDEMISRADAEGDDGLRLEIYRAISAAGHRGEAIEMMEPYIREHPDDEHAAEIYATSIESAHEESDPGERERAALIRFADRSTVVELRKALDAFMRRTAWGEIGVAFAEENLAKVRGDDLDPDAREKLAVLTGEIAITAAEADTDDDLSIDEVIEREKAGYKPETALTAFAGDPETPSELARRASEWAEYNHYGVWQLPNPGQKPGVWANDLVSGIRRYVEFPPGALDGAPPWTVWLGGVIPVDGIWRSTGTGLRLSPAEGDAVAEYADEAVQLIGLRMMGIPPDQLPAPEPIRFGRAEPYGAQWEYNPNADDGYVKLTSSMTAVLIPELVADVYRYRTSPPRLQNTDGDPMLRIDATVAVSGDVTGKLLAHPDFDWEYDDDQGRIVWWGKEVPAGQRDLLLAEVRARLPELVEEPDDEPQRWVRGYLTPGNGAFRVEVNSRQRLDRLIRVLGKLGASPAVTDEKRFDPAMDLAWGPGTPAAFGGAAAPSDGWEKWWLDESVPALDGLSPRDAARSGDDEAVTRLESMLRQFEYQSGLAAAQGEKGVDVGWLRAELGMTGEE